ncbi:MAG: DUF3604 domain-containing protein [Candidatus Latescibacteria bacterium]|jgi:hypothetical protein|nr:DUF3604 domain-containing protein [Candidatus Latescibacterota bacterium]
MTEDDRRELYGWAEVDPEGPVVAGETGTWRITYHAGRYGVDDGGAIKVAWRDVSDWEPPQFTDPGAPAYASVATTGPSSLRATFERNRYIRPWRRCVTIDVFDDSLSDGDTVTLTLGDRSGGSSGIRVQTFCKDAFEFRVAVDWCGTWVYERVPSPEVSIVSGPPHRLVVLTPSETAVGQEAWVGVKAEDLWGNPCREYDGSVRIAAGGLEGLPETYRFGPEDRGVRRFEGVKAPGAGVYRVRAEDGAREMSAEGNPMVCVDARGEYKPFWGDLHGQSEETVGTNPVSAYFQFARESAMVDFVGHQGNDFQITRAVWEEIKKQANTQHDPGRFVTFAGYEWSGNTPVGGDRNVYFLGDDGPLHRSSHVLIPDEPDRDTDCLHVTELFEALRGIDALAIPHVGGRYANLTWHDPEVEPVIEVYSEWGEFEWFLEEALAKGHKVGFTAGSDDHKGRPGAGHCGGGSFGVYGGLTCILARELTRAGLFEALKVRRCYGTTGQRIVLDVRADGHPMGSEFDATEPPEISVRVVGTAPIERIDVFRGAEPVYRYPAEIDRDDQRVRVAWSGQRIRARNRLVRWDGSLSLDRGRIVEAEGYAFDSASEGIREVSDRSVSWTSVTTGDPDGVVLTLDAPDDATIDFRTEVVNRSVSLQEIADGPVRVDAGGIEVCVVFEQLPRGVGTEAEFTFRDKDPGPGCHPYWVRVTQTDGAKAWASPVYVNISDPS